MTDVMEFLTEYMVKARSTDLPAEVAEKGKHHILDTIAAIISGATLEPGRLALHYGEAQGGTPEAQIIASQNTTTAVNAAFCNGLMAHSDETDDSHAPSGTHPGCAIVPAALAMAERANLSGKRLLNAVVLGYDLCARTMRSLGERYFLEEVKGFSSHSMGGVFGAAAAAGACAEFTTTQFRYLISYTAQQASGIPTWARDIDHIEKAFDFAGMPARNGVASAILVDSGFTGVWDVFQGERNFFKSFSPDPNPEEMILELGERFEISLTNIKKHCVGSPIQAAADALINILTNHPTRPEEVKNIKVILPVGGAKTVNNREMPNINLQHMMAVLIMDGSITFSAAHDVKRMADPATNDLRNKVELMGDDSLATPESPRQAIVELNTNDGKVYRERVVAVRGTMENPMSTEEVEAKARDLLALRLDSERAEQLIFTLANLESLGSVRELRPLLRA
jgi:2-methylcitrate dehydratase PrpD